eukprot:975952-Karenia_brevis.AAC.1
MKENEQESGKVEHEEVRELLPENAPLPPTMRRDEAFQHGANSSCQVEFVVDNQSVAGLANATLAATNPFYKPCIRRIRERLATSYMKHCQYKAGFFDP